VDIYRQKKRAASRKAALVGIGLGVAALVITPFYFVWRTPPAEPIVSLGDPILVDSVKRGPMLVDVHGVGKLVRTRSRGGWMASVEVPADRRNELSIGQRCDVDTREGWITGHVQIIGPVTQREQVNVGIALDAAPARTHDPGDEIDASIKIRRLKNVLYVGRPIQSEPYSSSTVFRLNQQLTEAVRVPVTFGAVATDTIEIVSGLKEGDRIVLFDMSEWDAVDRVLIR
jgi:multidrug efflux pump subunit AcrA (membrane-fusion protein)